MALIHYQPSTNGNELVTAITYGASSLTKLDRSVESTKTAVEVWYLLDPSVGTAWLNTTFNTDVAGSQVVATTYTGVLQSSPIGNYAMTQSAGSDTASVSVETSASDSTVFAAVTFENGDTTLDAPTGVTERYKFNTGTGPPVKHTKNVGGDATAANVGTTTATWATNPATATNWAAFAVELKQRPNTAPVASDGSLTTDEDTPGNGTLSATDAESDALTYSIVTDGSKGTAVITDASTGAYTYTPDADAFGSDSFTFKANDGTVDSNTATITVTIDPVNDAPVASDGTLTTDEDTPGSGTLSASDVDGDTLTYSIITDPSNGVISGLDTATGAYTYTPDAEFSGTDSFTFQANDGTVDSNTATVSVTITAVNDAPVANDGTLTTDEDTPGTGTLTGSDVDGDTITFSIDAQGSKGTATVTDTAAGLYEYVPDADAFGSDSFTFKTHDGTTFSAAATITITINPVNDAPVASDVSESTSEDTAYSGSLPASDVDGDSLTYSIVTGPSNGVISGLDTATGAYTYTPGTDFVGSDSFTFQASDGTLDSNTATVSVTITAVNDAPVASDASESTLEDTAYSSTLTGSDVEGDSLTYSIVTDGTKGTAVITDATTGAYTYTPATDAFGSDSFTFQANDGTSDSNIATVSVTINAVNDAPVANDGTLTTDEDTPGSGTLSASDVDGDSLTYSIVTGPSSGVISGLDSVTGAYTYTPDAEFSGTDSFTFQANDGTVDSNTATVSISVNSAPIASAGPDQVVTNGTLVTLDGTGSFDPDEDTITYLWTQLAGPEVDLSDVTAVDPDFMAPAGPVALLFQLEVTDSEGATDLDLVAVSVEATTQVSGIDGATVSIDPPPAESPIDGLNLTLGIGGTVDVTMTVYAEPPTGYPTPPAGTGGVFFELDVTPTDGVTVTQGTIRFSLPQSWFVDNACPASTCAVTLQHYTGGAWGSLATTRLGAVTDDPVAYEATTASFSPFVPAGVVPAPPVPGGGGGGGGGTGGAHAHGVHDPPSDIGSNFGGPDSDSDGPGQDSGQDSDSGPSSGGNFPLTGVIGFFALLAATVLGAFALTRMAPIQIPMERIIRRPVTTMRRVTQRPRTFLKRAVASTPWQRTLGTLRYAATVVASTANRWWLLALAAVRHAGQKVASTTRLTVQWTARRRAVVRSFVVAQKAGQVVAEALLQSMRVVRHVAQRSVHAMAVGTAAATTNLSRIRRATWTTVVPVLRSGRERSLILARAVVTKTQAGLHQTLTVTRATATRSAVATRAVAVRTTNSMVGWIRSSRQTLLQGMQTVQPALAALGRRSESLAEAAIFGLRIAAWHASRVLRSASWWSVSLGTHAVWRAIPMLQQLVPQKEWIGWQKPLVKSGEAAAFFAALEDQAVEERAMELQQMSTEDRFESFEEALSGDGSFDAVSLEDVDVQRFFSESAREEF